MRIIHIFILVLSLSLGTFLYKSTFAQTKQPFINITNVDFTQFPDVQLSFSQSSVAGNSLTVTELLSSGQESTYTSFLTDTTRTAGINLAVVIDPKDIDATRCQSMVGAMRNLISVNDDNKNILSNLYDRSALFTFNSVTLSLEAIRAAIAAEQTNWTVEPRYTTWHGVDGFCNPIISQSQTSVIANTGVLTSTEVLTPLLESVINEFTVVDTPEPNDPSAARLILLLSSGTTSFVPDGIIAEARKSRVHIYILQASGTEASKPQDQLQRLADETGGMLITLDALNDELLSAKLLPLWERIVEAHAQRFVVYRTNTIDLQDIKVSLPITDGTQSLTDSASLHGLSIAQKIANLQLQPPTIQLISPIQGEVIERAADKSTANNTNQTSQSLSITALITTTRQNIGLKQVSYMLIGADGQIITSILQDKEPFGEVSIPLSTVADGNYNLSIIATDELGQSNEPLISNFQVHQILPSPVPTQTPPSVPTATGINSPAEPAIASSANQVSESVASVTESISSESSENTAETPWTWKDYSFLLLLLLTIGYIFYLLFSWFRKEQGVDEHKATTVNSPINEINNQQVKAGTNPSDSKMSEAANKAEAENLLDQKAKDSVHTNDPSKRKTASKSQRTTGASSQVSREKEDSTFISIPHAQPVIGRLVRLDKAMDDANIQNVIKLPKELEILEGVPSSLGRLRDENQLVIDDPRVGRRQVQFIQENARLFIKHWGEGKGETYVNLSPLKPGQRMLLRDGDQINFGEIAYVYRTQHKSDSISATHAADITDAQPEATPGL